MYIFLRRIPANTKHVEIADFVSPALSNGLFKKPGRILNIEILALRDIRIDSIEYHGLVALDSEWTVKQAVRELKNRRLNGRFVMVRRYYHRNACNDQRRYSAAADEQLFIEKRHGDRRRGQFLEIIKNVSDRLAPADESIETVCHQQIQVMFIVPADIEMKVAECFVNFELERAAGGLGTAEAYPITRFLTELEGPEKRSRRFQIFTTRAMLSALLEKIRKEFSGNDIYYWITPVIEFGII